jgi:hypothetical protein
MKTSKFAMTGLLLGAVLSTLAFVGNGCDVNGSEGDTCNPLVQQNECNSGLQCTQTTCTYAYCCPISGTSSNPNCNFGGCPDQDAEADADDDDASETDATPIGDSSTGLDAAPAVDASDAALITDAPDDAADAAD